MTNRIKFSLIHLFFSLILTLSIIAWVLMVWYPGLLACSLGVCPILVMIMVVDVVIGPLLLFLVYKEGKRTLKLDISVIIAIQLASLTFGVYSVFEARPVFVVFSVDRFELVGANQLYTLNKKDALIEYQSVPFFGPDYVAVRFSDNPKIRSQDTFDELVGGVAISTRLERYVSLSDVKAELSNKALDLLLLEKTNSRQAVESVLNHYQQASGWFPLQSYGRDMVILINKKNAKVLGVVDLNPW